MHEATAHWLMKETQTHTDTQWAQIKSSSIINVVLASINMCISYLSYLHLLHFVLGVALRSSGSSTRLHAAISNCGRLARVTLTHLLARSVARSFTVSLPYRFHRLVIDNVFGLLAAPLTVPVAVALGANLVACYANFLLI